VLLLGALALLCAALPFAYWDGGAGTDRIYFGSDTQAVGLVLGGLTAVLWHHARAHGNRPRLVRVRGWLGTAALLAVAWHTPDPRLKSQVGGAGVALATALMLPMLVEGRGAVARVLSSPPMRWLGRRSYALYLWNYVWATWTHGLGLWPGVPLGVAATIASAELSWFLVERPVLRARRRRTGPSQGEQAGTAQPLARELRVAS
jgi:peptidoglycan/LPS O-acetylase OafA/YrhL